MKPEDLALILGVLLIFMAVGGAICDRLFPPEWWDARNRNR